MQYMTCNFALIDVDLAINQCQDLFMHNRKDRKRNIRTSWEYTCKLLFLCCRRTRNCIMCSDITVNEEMKYLPYRKRLKIVIGLIPLYAINCQPKRHDIHIKGLCQNESFFFFFHFWVNLLSACSITSICNTTCYLCHYLQFVNTILYIY
jgi:hypothetical protein